MDPNTPQGSCSWFEPTIFSWEQWIGGLLLIGALAGLIWLQLASGIRNRIKA
jgi:hypothetical protein